MIATMIALRVCIQPVAGIVSKARPLIITRLIVASSYDAARDDRGRVSLAINIVGRRHGPACCAGCVFYAQLRQIYQAFCVHSSFRDRISMCFLLFFYTTIAVSDCGTDRFDRCITGS